jgi:type IV secretory pathway VirD2 relaxase
MAAENPRAKTNAVHISLNFDPSEKLSPQTMTEIAQKYMEKIDFGGQPYLVYQHYDAGHPHMHIVTTNIESDGTRIDLHNIGKNQSETARKELEKIYNLVPAESKTQQEAINVKAIKAEKVQYGKSETSGQYPTWCVQLPKTGNTARSMN